MRYDWQKLQAFASQCFRAVGVPAEDADWTANVLVKAELTGVSTHGLSRLHAYMQAIKRGIIKACPDIKYKKNGLSVGVMDGDSGLGPVVARQAMSEANSLANETGIGIVTVKRGNHIGPLSAYLDIAIEAGMVGWLFTNAQPAIPPWGGKQAFFGTNPIAFAAPTKSYDPIVIDLATSKVARGNIIQAAKSNKPIPDNWAIDETGKPTTDAHAALRGAVLPMAEAKGYALALMVETLCGVLSGAEIGPNVGSIYSSDTRESGTGICCIVIDPDCFFDKGVFLERMDSMVEAIHRVPTADGFESIRIPGERRKQLEIKNRQTGILLEETTVNELMCLAQEHGLAWIE